MQTKTVNLTEDEIQILINQLGYTINTESAYKIERINYLNKRLKAFKEPEVEIVKSNNSAAGWGSVNEEA